jgi:hypothetical protein
MRKICVLVVVLLACLTLTCTAAAMDRGKANTRAFALAKWKAACGQGHWKCSSATILGALVKTGHDSPEWRANIIVARSPKGAPHNMALCLVHVSLNHDGSTHALTIECGPANDPGGDIPILP